MKHIKAFILGIIGLISMSCSSNATANKIEENDSLVSDITVKPNSTLLWKIEGKGIKPAYLFGTMHMINKEYFHFSENLTDRITNSDAIIMEVGGMVNPLAAFQMMMIDSGTVHDYFSKEQLIQLLEFMDVQMGVSPEEFDKTYGSMKPFFIMQSISQSYFEPGAESYDLTIMGLAGEHEIPLIGLETIEEQLAFFDSIPQTEMAELIISSTENFEKEQKDAIKLMKFYAEQKVEKLIPLLEKQSPEFMAYADLFLYDRNKRWVPKLEEEMKAKSCFIAVGAGHLFGDGGLIDLLKKEGYTLTPISAE